MAGRVERGGVRRRVLTKDALGVALAACELPGGTRVNDAVPGGTRRRRRDREGNTNGARDERDEHGMTSGAADRHGRDGLYAHEVRLRRSESDETVIRMPETIVETSLRQELEREHERIRLMREVSLALGSTLDLETILSIVVDRVSRLLDADRATLYLIDDATSELWSQVAQGDGTLEIRLNIGEGLAGWCARHGRSVNVKDAAKDPRFDARWDERTGYQTQSALCVPLRNHHGRTVGVLQALNKSDGYFSPDDEGLLQALAAQTAVAIENSKLFLATVGKNMELIEAHAQLEKRVRELDVLFELAQATATAPDLQALLDGLLERAMRAVGADAGCILLPDGETGDLVFRAALGGDPEAVLAQRIPAGTGISGWVARNGEAQIVNDVRGDDRHSREIAERVGYEPKTLLCVPLRGREGVGALELLNKQGARGGFDEDDVKLATVIASSIGAAFDLAYERELREKTERLSSIGHLLASVLHDLRTPMTVIGGYVPAMIDEPDAAMRRAHSERVLRQVRFVNAMTNEVLAFARGESVLLRTKIYLPQFFTDLVDQLRGIFSEKGVAIELELGDRGTAYFDPQKVERAAFNLARNAVEAFAGRPGVFRIRVSREEQGLLVEFEDDGPGISSEIRGRLFESFSTHGKRGGTGLGLAIVRKIADDHGGSIGVASKVGKTVFSLRIPHAEA